MNKLVNVFVDICLLRSGPQDLPASQFLLVLTAALGLMTGTVVLIDAFGDIATALMAQIVDLVFVLLFLKLGLSYKRLESRFVQSVTGLFGAGAVINLATMPIQLMMGNPLREDIFGELGVLLYLFLMVWAIVVMAHVLRHTLDIKFGPASLLAISYFFFINIVIQLLFPVQ